MNKKIKIAFDLDEVICKRPKNLENLGVDKYQHCRPIKKNIDLINKLYDKNFFIMIYTSRGMTQFNANIKLIKKKLQKLTLNQLKKWGVKYDRFCMGKLHYDLLIDDKAINSKGVKLKDIKNILNFK